MPTVAWVALGGALGASARWLSQTAVARWTGASAIGTFSVNIVGCFVLGLWLGRSEGDASVDPARRAFVATGFLGAFTTFSTFAADGESLWRRESSMWALIYVGASVVFGLGAFMLGRSLARPAAAGA